MVSIGGPSSEGWKKRQTFDLDIHGGLGQELADPVDVVFGAGHPESRDHDGMGAYEGRRGVGGQQAGTESDSSKAESPRRIPSPRRPTCFLPKNCQRSRHVRVTGHVPRVVRLTPHFRGRGHPTWDRHARPVMSASAHPTPLTITYSWRTGSAPSSLSDKSHRKLHDSHRHHQDHRWMGGLSTADGSHAHPSDGSGGDYSPDDSAAPRARPVA
jgi:hypothetical protein